jgi:hypothetical protein
MVSATGIQCTHMATATVFFTHNVKCVSCACVFVLDAHVQYMT